MVFDARGAGSSSVIGDGRGSMNILLFVPVIWGAVTAFIVAACRMASLADVRSEQVELEPSEFAR
ncbi:MAG TPA: hypothetical protein VK605_03165 [Solirubrobacteraceae bacterium]|nr:hypothetical protein [Solirubrobacteraceae bacterium]